MREYARSRHSDVRIRERLITMGVERSSRRDPADDLPRRGGAEGGPVVESEGDHILEGHQEAMVERCRSQRLILAIQDTTFLNYNGLEAGLVDIGGSGTPGMAVHAGVAFSEGGSSLGLFHLDADFRLKPEEGRGGRQGEPADTTRNWPVLRQGCW